ncbi:MAG: hypothetical protein IJP70_09875 [Bacteroidales bacterium]|nr:hypothetical protein [Bacteroidales bacterium]
MIPILLTATVNPNGMQGASFSVEERAQMYVEALRFYMGLSSFGKTFTLVFAENSGSLEAVKKAFDERSGIEWLDVSGSEYDQTRGKGYNETIIIQKAIERSDYIRQSGCFFKVTGRLKVLNIEKLLKECAEPGLRFKADCKDHRVYELLHMPINGHSGECRYWFATADFFRQTMWKYLDRLNDYGEKMFLAEDAMLAVCRETRGQNGCKDRFRTQARISGRGGHNLGKGLSFFYSTDNDSFALKFKCFLRQLLRWFLPFWRC